MRSSTLSAAAVVLSAIHLAQGQTFTDCNPLTNSSCPSDPALGTTLTTDFTQGASSDWTLADGTTMTYDGTNGAQFTIKVATDAPTISSAKYIMFGQVDVVMKACAGVGMVSSFILESDDLDEIDWEWLGANDTSVESNFFGKGNTTTYDRALYHTVATPIETYHTYTIVWTSASIKWSIDGALQRTLNYGDALALGGKNYPQTPMRIKMGNWVGCASAAAAANGSPTQGTCEWAGGPADFSKGPFVMSVQKVTIQDYGCGTSYSYGDMTGSFESIQSAGCSSGSASATSTSSASSSASSGSTGTSTSSASNSTETKTSGTGSTTMATATSESTAKTTTSSSSSSSTSSPAQATSSSGNVLKPKYKYGVLDVAVMVLGLGLGYLVM